MREESNRIGSRQSKWKCGMAGEIKKSAEGKEIHTFLYEISNKQEAQEGKDVSKTCGSPTAQQIPIVAPMLSPIHRFTACMQPRT